MADQSATMLTRDLLESQLAMVELLLAMYPPTEEEQETNSTTNAVMERIREYCDNPDNASTSPASIGSLPSSLDLTVTIPIDDTEKPLQMNILVPLTANNHHADPLDLPPISYTLRQPPWLSRAELLSLSSDMPQDDILAAFDHLTTAAPQYLAAHRLLSAPPPPPASSSYDDDEKNEPLLRVWFYFPSLSTRAKRNDLVTYAARYHLTGFVLAGKPGVLCLEGRSRAIDAYMNAIKNESWGDIPSHQKKVSERLREQCAARRFAGMREITDELEKRGARRNRGDMAALEAFMREMGVGDSFGRVIMGV